MRSWGEGSNARVLRHGRRRWRRRRRRGSAEKLRWALERHGWRYYEKAYPYGFHVIPILQLSPLPPATQQHTAPLLIVPAEASDSGKDEVPRSLRGAPRRPKGSGTAGTLHPAAGVCAGGGTLDRSLQFFRTNVDQQIFLMAKSLPTRVRMYPRKGPDRQAARVRAECADSLGTRRR